MVPDNGFERMEKYRAGFSLCLCPGDAPSRSGRSWSRHVLQPGRTVHVKRNADVKLGLTTTIIITRRGRKLNS